MFSLILATNHTEQNTNNSSSSHLQNRLVISILLAFPDVMECLNTDVSNDVKYCSIILLFNSQLDLMMSYEKASPVYVNAHISL